MMLKMKIIILIGFETSLWENGGGNQHKWSANPVDDL